jgi:large subunit ribosomal protein L15
LAQRIPKMKGFRPRPTRKLTVTTGELSKIKGTEVTPKVLADANVIDSEYRWVKLINKGEVKSSFTVKLAAISEGAKLAVEKAGGSFVETQPQKRPVKNKKD